jgi:hypothetical protein
VVIVCRETSLTLMHDAGDMPEAGVSVGPMDIRVLRLFIK